MLFLGALANSHQAGVNLTAAYAAQSLQQWDEAVTARITGCSSLSELYGATSLAALLPRVLTPTLLVHVRGHY